MIHKLGPIAAEAFREGWVRSRCNDFCRATLEQTNPAKIRSLLLETLSKTLSGIELMAVLPQRILPFPLRASK